MKKTILALTLIACACSSKNNFSKIHKGMRSSDVVALVGQPDHKQPMMMAEWWRYQKPEPFIVVIENDTVANAGTQKELMTQMSEGLKFIDSATSK